MSGNTPATTEERYLRLLRFARFERRAGGWRFGTRKIDAEVLQRLLARGAIGSDGNNVWLAGRAP